MLAFKIADTNGDGFVSVDEWNRDSDAASARLPAGPAAKEYRCRLTELFENLDSDRDQRLSTAEWRFGKFKTNGRLCDVATGGKASNLGAPIGS
jgi:hypothetical protein